MVCLHLFCDRRYNCQFQTTFISFSWGNNLNCVKHRTLTYLSHLPSEVTRLRIDYSLRYLGWELNISSGRQDCDQFAKSKRKLSPITTLARNLSSRAEQWSSFLHKTFKNESTWGINQKKIWECSVFCQHLNQVRHKQLPLTLTETYERMKGRLTPWWTIEARLRKRPKSLGRKFLLAPSADPRKAEAECAGATGQAPV